MFSVDSASNVLSPVDFGAKFDGATDDSGAIQTAVSAALASIAGFNGATVACPMKRASLAKPIVIDSTAGHLTFRGSGRGATYLWSNGYVGPSIIISHGNTLPLLPSLTGAGNALDMDHLVGAWLNLRDYLGMHMNGWGAFTVELGKYLYTPTAAAHDCALLGAYGQRFTNENSSSAFMLYLGAGGWLSCSATLGGTKYTLPAASLTPGATYDIALSYDGSTLRLFLNGALASSLPATGAVSMRDCEDIAIGGTRQFWPEGGQLTSTGGVLDSVRICSYARYVANYTPSPAKPTYDTSGIVCIIDFSQPSISPSVLTALVGHGGVSWPWYMPIRGISWSGSFHTVRDLTLGSGLYAAGAQNLSLRHLTFDGGLTSHGVMLQNNCYQSALSELSFVESGDPRLMASVALLNNAGLTSVRDCFIPSPSVGLVATGSSLALSSVYVIGSTVGAAFLNPGGGNVSIQADGLVLGDEGRSSPLECSLAIDSIVSGHFAGCCFLQTLGTGPVVKLSGDMPLEFVGGSWRPPVGAAEIIHSIHASPVRQTVIRSPGYWSKPSPFPAWSSTPGLVTVENA